MDPIYSSLLPMSTLPTIGTVRSPLALAAEESARLAYEYRFTDPHAEMILHQYGREAYEAQLAQNAAKDLSREKWALMEAERKTKEAERSCGCKCGVCTLGKCTRKLWWTVKCVWTKPL